MDLISELKSELDKGFSKSDLEYLIGLPKNTLCSCLKGKRIFSKKSILKIKKFMSSDIPDPLVFKKSVKKEESEVLKTEILYSNTKPSAYDSPINTDIMYDELTQYPLPIDSNKMPEGLHWKEQIEWLRNKKKKQFNH